MGLLLRLCCALPSPCAVCPGLFVFLIPAGHLRLDEISSCSKNLFIYYSALTASRWLPASRHTWRCELSSRPYIKSYISRAFITTRCLLLGDHLYLDLWGKMMTKFRQILCMWCGRRTLPVYNNHLCLSLLFLGPPVDLFGENWRNFVTVF